MEQHGNLAITQTGNTALADSPVDVTSALLRFVDTLDRAFALPDTQRVSVRNDFIQGIAVLSAQGMPFAEILCRLDPDRLHGFYAQPRQEFYPLDDGAKQYPLAMLNGQIAMFRLAASLDEPVNPTMLQLALLFTLRRFPHYATRLYRGAFWYYLKPFTARYAITPDTGAVCAPIDVSDETQPLFRVLYSGRRVSVELLHILTDGMGGMMFLKSLLTEYYRLQGEQGSGKDTQVLDAAAPLQPEEIENSFARFRTGRFGEGLLGTPAVQLPARRLSTEAVRVDHFLLSAEELKTAAHRYGVSVTALMGAVILTACRNTAQARTGTYKLQVTSDLRRIFHSRTLRNFSWYSALCSDAETKWGVSQLALNLQRQICAMKMPVTLERNLSAAQRAIHILRVVPLPWKAALLRSVYRVTGDYFFTTTLSNLGIVELHTPLKAHVREIAAVLGLSPSNPYGFAMATVNGRAVLSVTRTTDDTTMLNNLAESASAYGLTLRKRE